MSILFTKPETLMAAATDLAGVRSTINAVNEAAATPTTRLPAPGIDEVSAAVVAVFGAHAQQYQATSARAQAIHDQFVQAMKAAGHAYADAEAANASSVQTAVGHPLLRGCAYGAAGTGSLGGPGEVWVW